MSTPNNRTSPFIVGEDSWRSPHSGNVSVATPSLSPSPLSTPQTIQTVVANSKSQSTTLKRSRTPMAIQLERLLQPTPANATTTPAAQQTVATATPAVATPSSATRLSNIAIVPSTPSPHTIDRFLQQSGLPPDLSRTMTNVFFTLLSWILAILDVTLDAIASRFQVWWNDVISKKFPNTADVAESLLEYTLEVCQFLFGTAKFLSPYMVWLIQTFIALVLLIGGSLICGLIILVDGRDAARKSGAGEVQSSSIKILSEAVQNSPFYSRKAVPFTPRFVATNIRVDDKDTAPAVGGLGDVQNTTRSFKFKLPPAATVISSNPSAAKSTPPISVSLRSSLKSNQNTPNISKPTPNTRRVLFSESEHGEVDAEQFFYDKTLPSASARKVGRVNDNREQLMIMANETRNETSNETSPLMASSISTVSAPENKILRPSSFSLGDSSETKIPQILSQVTTTNQGPSAAVKKQDEQIKQQYIEKYGLLPTITPLSKRYGRMKRQHNESIAITDPSFRNTTTLAAGIHKGSNNNAKRKRRDLLGAASRMERRRLNNFRAGGTSLPVVLLGKNRTPMKRQREDELNRADEWVWRAMNSNGEKENLDSQGGATKRAKFVNDGPSDLSTPPIIGTNALTRTNAFPSVTTPPKTPGPSIGSATPAPSKKPSFVFNTTSSAEFSFGKKESSSGSDVADAEAMNPDNNEDNGPSFSFGSTDASKPTEKSGNSSPSFSFRDTAAAAASKIAAPLFSVGASSSSSTTVKPDEKKAVSFSFGAANENKVAEKSQAIVFGATSTPAHTGVEESTVNDSFSFNSSGQTNAPVSSTTPSETKHATSSSAAPQSSGFVFGATNQTSTQGETKQAPSFSFGDPGVTTQSSLFSFGANNSVAFPPASATPASMFAFGGQTPGDVTTPNLFALGGSGASARRRAKAAARRK